MDIVGLSMRLGSGSTFLNCKEDSDFRGSFQKYVLIKRMIMKMIFSIINDFSANGTYF